MKHTRIVVNHYGGPDELRVVEEECPEPKQGEKRVRVLAAGCVMMREGIHPETPKVPFTPGWDLVGVVDRVGNGIAEASADRARKPKSGEMGCAETVNGSKSEAKCYADRATSCSSSKSPPIALLLHELLARQSPYIRAAGRRA